MTDNKITDEGAKYIAGMIKVNDTLEQINLFCKFRYVKWGSGVDEFPLYMKKITRSRSLEHKSCWSHSIRTQLSFTWMVKMRIER